MKVSIQDLEKFNERERELFARALNTLLGGTFILREVEKEQALYRFVISHFEHFEAYLVYMNWHLRKDESLGVITCEGPPGGRINFNLEETLGLLVLRVLYEEKRMEVSLARETVVHQYEILEKYKVLAERELNKTRYLRILRRFKSLKLIQIKGDEKEPDTLIVLYPSIVFSLDMETLERAHERIEELGGKEAENVADPDEEDVDADFE